MTTSPPQIIDWDLAVRLGTKLAGDGPAISRTEADSAVAELRAGAHLSTPLVAEFTGLHADADTAPVLVVDRAGWVQANADAFSTVLAPVVAKMTEKKPPSGLSLAVGSKITGAEVGGLLGFLAAKVLGQFDPFHDPAGRLLLVAPNIVHVERELERRPDRLPPVGVPARGDPPCAVHRCAVDARPHLLPGRAAQRHHGHRQPPRRRPGPDQGGDRGARLRRRVRRAVAAAVAASWRCSAAPSSAR